MRTRIMPKGLQIYLFKKLFRKWNAYRERESEGYDVAAEMDKVDWSAVVDETQTFRENLHELQENYPEYGWYDWEAEERERAREQERVFREMADSEPGREPEDSTPEEDVEPEDSEGWPIEQTDDDEIHSIEVEVEPHRTRAKGKQYLYGRIQLSVDQNWIGLTAKISVSVPRT